MTRSSGPPAARGHATSAVFTADRYRACITVAAEPGATPDYEEKVVELVPSAEGAVAIEALLIPRPRRRAQIGGRVEVTGWRAKMRFGPHLHRRA